MPIELGQPKYYKYSECTEGQKLVVKGEFMGVTEGRYGDQYTFYEDGSGDQVVLNRSGQLAWRIEQGQIAEGGYYDIEYSGTEQLSSGTFKGKDAHKFKISVYSTKELEGKAVEVAEKPKVDQTEALDDLE